MKKKVVINALQYKQNSSGIGVLIRELFAPYAAGTKRACQVILSEDSPAFPSGERAQQVRIPFRNGQSLRRIWFQSVDMGRQYCKDAVLLTTDSKVPLALPGSCMPLPLVTDLAVFRMPQVYKLSRVLLWKLQYRLLCRRAKHFLAISEFTKREMTELLRIPPENIHVIPCAHAKTYAPMKKEEARAAIAQRYQLPEKYLLFVGNSNPRKNLERMIRAFDAAKEQGSFGHHLVIAGEQGWKFERSKALEGVRHESEIHFIGFVLDEDMNALYAAADLFVFPTLYEGFGIPVLEAQACGTPVLTSGCSSLPEVGGEAAVYVDPYAVQDIAAGIVRILTDTELSGDLIQKGFANAKRFSWQASAQKLERTIEEIVP